MSSIGSTPPIDPTGLSERSTQSRFSELTSEDFVRVIFTELTNQDPLEPNDTGALLEQLSSIRNIEADMQMQNRLESLVFENQMASASGLIGKFIGGLTDDAERVAGYVVSVVREDDRVMVELDNGWFVSFDNVETVVDPSIFDDVGGGGGGGGGDGGGDGSSGSDGDDLGGDEPAPDAEPDE